MVNKLIWRVNSNANHLIDNCIEKDSAAPSGID